MSRVTRTGTLERVSERAESFDDGPISPMKQRKRAPAPGGPVRVEPIIRIVDGPAIDRSKYAPRVAEQPSFEHSEPRSWELHSEPQDWRHLPGGDLHNAPAFEQQPMQYQYQSPVQPKAPVEWRRPAVGDLHKIMLTADPTPSPYHDQYYSHSHMGERSVSPLVDSYSVERAGFSADDDRSRCPGGDCGLYSREAAPPIAVQVSPARRTSAEHRKRNRRERIRGAGRRALSANAQVPAFREMAHHHVAQGGDLVSNRRAESFVPKKEPSRAANEGRVRSYQDQLVFSKKPRAVSYKPKTLADYKKLNGNNGRYMELGKLQPDLNDEKLVKKRAEKIRMNDYGRQLRKINKQTIAADIDRRRRLPPPKEEPREPTKRERAVAYVSRIPKPKVPAKGTSPRSEGRDGFSPKSIRGGKCGISRAEELEMKREHMLQEVDAIRKEFGL